jgi:hypothetical protein
MNSSTNQFYEQYGLTNVREAMKRPFSKAFPVSAVAPVPVQPRVPQIRVHLPAFMPQWVRLPTSVEENPAKRQRVEEINSVQPPVPVFSILSSLPVLAMRPQSIGMTTTFSPSPAKSDTGAVTENYLVEGVTDDDLVQCVQYLGLEYTSGKVLMRAIFVRMGCPYSSDQRFETMKEVLSLLNMIGENIGKKSEQGKLEIPEKLLKKLVFSSLKFLNNTENDFRTKRDLRNIQMRKLVLALLNNNSQVCSLLEKFTCFNVRDDYRFVGGETRFRVICWCNSNKILLTENEIDKLSKININKTKDILPIYKKIKEETNTEQDG